MTKKQLLEKINSVDSDDYDLNEIYNYVGYGTASFLGEYAFPDMDELEVDMIKEDFENFLELKYFTDFNWETYSSKSGTGVWLEGFTCNDFADEIYYVQNDASEDDLMSKLKEDWDYIKSQIKEHDETKEKIEKEIEKARKWIESYAIGVRYACFSNGEVCFRPINKKRTGYTEVFTPYYNPNEE